MHANEVKRRIKAQPFEPFVINMSDGRQFAIRHPELLHVFPGIERTAVLGIPEDESHEIIDLIHVASLPARSRGTADAKAGGAGNENPAVSFVVLRVLRGSFR